MKNKLVKNSYINIGWRYIFLNNMYMNRNYQLKAGGRTKITTKEIKSITEYNKNIYKSMNKNELSYNDYLNIVKLTDFDFLVHNVSDFLDGRHAQDIYKTLYDFNKLTAIEELHTGEIQSATQINNLYNKNKMALIFTSINIPRVINGIRNHHKFDVYISKGNLPVNQLDKFEKELKDMNVVENIYGSYKKSGKAVYNEIVKENNNKYDNIAIINESTIYNRYPTIFMPLEMPVMMMKLIFGLSMLKEHGNVYIYMKVTYKYPLLVQFFDIIANTFKSVETERLRFNKYNIVVHCFDFDKKKYEKYANRLNDVFQELDDYVIDNDEYNAILDDKLFYKVGRKGKDIDVVYKMNIIIPSTKIGESITNHFEACYYEYLNYIDYMMVQYIPLTSKNTNHILKTIVYDYIVNLVKFFEQNKISYNKYYLSLLDDYYKNIVKEMMSLANNINVQLVNYPNRSISLKRNKSKTKKDRRSRTRSFNKPKDFLGKITGKNSPYVYDDFKKSLDRITYTKNTRQKMQEVYGYNKDKIITRISEDFTRGISLYLHKRYRVNPVPSNAFTKLWEIYSAFNLVPNKKVVRMFHLAEAPGQFIKATEYYINKRCPRNEKYLWKANSLNPANKEVTEKYGTALFRDDYGLIKKNKENWIWGKDTTGDITRSHNVKWYRNYLSKWLGNDRLDVITGDGGLEIENQMVELQKLDYGQFLLAAATNTIGGACVIKTFTPFLGSKPETINASGFFVGLTYLYSLLYRNVYLVKPYTSRPSSGEYYVVGKGFVGLSDDILDKLLKILDNFEINQTFFNKEHIPKAFIKQTAKFIEQMTENNISTIERQMFFIACSNYKDSVIDKKTNCKYYLNPKNLDEIHNERYKKWVNMFNFK